jgi:hypothetical protein
LYDIRGGRIPEVTQIVAQQRGGAAELRKRLVRVSQLMQEMTAAVEGLPIPTPVLEGTRNPWPKAVVRPRQGPQTFTEMEHGRPIF